MVRRTRRSRVSAIMCFRTGRCAQKLPDRFRPIVLKKSLAEIFVRQCAVTVRHRDSLLIVLDSSIERTGISRLTTQPTFFNTIAH